MPPSKNSAKRINLTATGVFRKYLDFLNENTSLNDTSVIRFCVAEEAKRRGYQPEAPAPAKKPARSS
jgi:hypothetical protein